MGYPVLYLGDIRFAFIHATDPIHEKDCLIARCQRVDLNNLVFMMSEKDGCSYEDLIKFDELPFKHKVVNCCQFRSTTKESFSIVNHCSNMG